MPARGDGPARARAPARNGSSRRHAVRGSASRHQARSDRQEDSQAVAHWQMVTDRTVSTLRIVFFGTPAFAVPTLDALLASAHAVVGVVTQPDRPRGRGHHVSDAPV